MPHDPFSSDFDDEQFRNDIDQHVSGAPGIDDANPQVVRDEAHVPITITIDVNTLLKSELGWTEYNAAGGYDDYDPRYSKGGNGRIIDIVTDKLATRIEEPVRKAVVEAIRESAVGKVDALIDELMTDEIVLTSKYGDAKSAPTTLREQMVQAMVDRLEQPVDDQGRRKSDSYGRSYTYIAWRAEQTAKAVMDKEMSGRISKAAADIKAAANTLVSQMIAKGLGQQ